MIRKTEHEPAAVPKGPAPSATQAGEARDRFPWAEPSVWSPRMLAALHRGVKGGVWFSLIDKVYSSANLRASLTKVVRNGGSAGVDHVTTEEFDRRSTQELEKLSRPLRDGTSRPQAIKQVNIPKPGTNETRPLGIPTVRDRVVQGALRNVLEPIFEREFAEHSYGFRPGRGCKDALRRVDGLWKSGYRYVVDVDLKSYFDTIPHGRLLGEVRRYVSDGRVLDLIEGFLKAEILDGLRNWEPESGAPQGAVLSPLLSNLYLNDLDHQMAGTGYEMTRYADDLVIQCRTLEDARRALERVRAWTAERGLKLHPTKTKIVDTRDEAFEFLGYRFFAGERYVRRKSRAKLAATVRRKTRRSSGQSLEMIIAQLDPTLRGWFGYFQHCHRSTLESVDGWVRMRLRSILRKRSGRRGRARGADHQKWPNRYFAERGLFSLDAAHQSVVRSSRR